LKPPVNLPESFCDFIGDRRVQEVYLALRRGTGPASGEELGIEEAWWSVHETDLPSSDLLGRALASIVGLRTAVVDTIYPPRCLACTEATETPQGLCAACWREMAFISGTACVKCGLPMLGEPGPEDICDGCLRHPPAWDRGAAVFLYEGTGRRLVLLLKHGDRLDMVPRLAAWMGTAGARVLADADLIAPVPLHWRRLVHRRYNQSAELVRRLARVSGRPAVVDLLRRRRMTIPQEGMDRAARAANQAQAFDLTPRQAARVRGARVVLVDDVMTSGATLSSCAEALRAAGAARIDVLVLARVAFAESLHI
jgi:ComF family protein